jgi:hypothetical protein
MAKQTKSRTPLNMSDSIQNMMLVECGVMSIEGTAAMIGVMKVMTPVGHYDFFVNQEGANRLIQELRDFLAGDSPNLLDDEPDNPS